MRQKTQLSAVLWIIIMFIMLTSTSCGLKRSNPLDPEGNPNINTPPPVMELKATASAVGAQSKYVELTWNWQEPTTTTGYLIYMSLAYNAAYRKVGYIGNLDNPDLDKVTYRHPNLVPNDYFFKVSACEYHGNSINPPSPLDDHSDYLEGALSEFVYIRVPN